MTREQLTAQEGQQDQTAGAHEAGDIQGLPPHVYHKVMSLHPTPAGAQTLADLMLEQGGAFAESILRLAAGAPNLGNHTVQMAIQIVQSRAPAREAQAQGRPPSDVVPQDDLAGMDGQKLTPLSPQLREQIMALGPDDVAQLARLLAHCPHDQHDALLMAARTTLGSAMVARALEITQHGGAPTGEAAPSTSGTAPAANATGSSTDGAAPSTSSSAHKPALGPAQVAAAEAYNRAHPHWVEEFDALTNYGCHVEDGHGELAANAVAQWQKNHSLDADGKVGPHTVQKAREVYASEKPQVASAAPQADARPPV